MSQTKLLDVDIGIFNLEQKSDTPKSHIDLKRKVQHFKTKLDEITRLYQNKRENGQKLNQTLNSKTNDKCNVRTSTNNNNLSNGQHGNQIPVLKHSIQNINNNANSNNTSLQSDQYILGNSKITENENNNDKNLLHNNKRGIMLRESRPEPQLLQKVFYRRSLSYDPYNTSNNKPDPSSSNRKQQNPKTQSTTVLQNTTGQPNTVLLNTTCQSKTVEQNGRSSETPTENGERIQTPTENMERVLSPSLRQLQRKFSNDETISVDKIKFLTKQNEELLLKCNSYSLENKKLKEISNFWMKSGYGGENIKMADECEKLITEKTKVEEELFRSQLMLDESSRLRVEIEECLLILQKDQRSKNNEVMELRHENEVVKDELESMKIFCMENDDKIRRYQLLEIKLRECLQKAVSQITELELQAKEKSMDDDFVMGKLINDYEKLFNEHETTKLLYGDSLRKVEELMKEIKVIRKQISLSDKSFESPRKRWFSPFEPQQPDFFTTRNDTEYETSEYDSSSTNTPTKATRRSRIPRRSQSVSSKHRSVLHDRPTVSKRQNRTYSGGTESDTESVASSVASSLASSAVSPIRRYPMKKEIDTEDIVTPHKKNLTVKVKGKDVNDTDDDKLEKDSRHLSWYATMKTTNQNGSKKKEKISSPVSPGVKPYFDEIIHPAVTTEEVLQAVQSSLTIPKFTSTPVKTQTKSQSCSEPVDQSQSLEDKLSELNAEKKTLEANLSRIPTRGSLRLTNSGNNSRYWINQEEKYETRYEEVVKEIGSIRMSMRKLNSL